MNGKPLPRYTDDIVVTVEGDFPTFRASLSGSMAGYCPVTITAYSKRYDFQYRAAVYKADMLAEAMERALRELARMIGESAVFGRPLP